jgi:hypothetical protein
MAESNHRSYRDPKAARPPPTPPRDQPDDPLAGLARLIGQSLITNDSPSDARRPTAAGSRSAREFNTPAQHGYAAPTDVVQETSEEQYSPPEQGSYDFDPPTHDEGRYESLPRADLSPQSGCVWYEHESDAADRHVEASCVRCGDCEEDQSHDHSDDHADDDDYDKHPVPRRRGGFIFVAAVVGLALLGTAGAFAYRAPFADSIVPSLLSIITAQGGPNKIVPTSTDFQKNLSPQTDADNAGSSERPNEDRLADVPPRSTASQPVHSTPTFADAAPAPEPGAAFPPIPSAQPAPAARVEILNSPPAAPVPPIPSADQAAAPSAPTPASPTKRGPKKIHTVSIRTDQPNGSESAASQPQSVPVRPTTQQEAAKASDANGPLSIVPPSNDAATAATGSARKAPSARPASVGKPAPTKIASTSPAASGGGYAVQISSQRNEKEVQPSFRALQAKYPKLLGGREPMVRRADLGAKGIYYRTMVGPFVSAEQANELCSNLKAAGGTCIVQKN